MMIVKLSKHGNLLERKVIFGFIFYLTKTLGVDR